MYFSTSTILAAALSLTSLTTAAPTSNWQPEGCSVFPWFIVPYADSASCSSTPAVYQPNSGPFNPHPAPSSGCQTLWSGTPQSFASVSINRDACPQQPWAIKLYVDAACATEPHWVYTDSCVASPGWNAAARWESFEAVLLQ